jgi:hypothetical protein
LHDPEFIKFQKDRGIEPVLDSSPEAAKKFLAIRLPALRQPLPPYDEKADAFCSAIVRTKKAAAVLTERL